MRGPHDIDLVAHAVRPVVTQVVQHQGQNPQRNTAHGPFGKAVGLIHRDVDAQRGDLGEGVGHLAQQAMVQAGDGVGNVVDRYTAPPGHPGLEQDGEHEYGYGVNNGIHGFVSLVMQRLCTGHRHR
jgi:hypothetical protein